MRTRIILCGIVAVALAACTTGATSAPSPSPEPSPSPAAVSPSPAASETPEASVTPLAVKVHFDGTTCRYIGPEVFPEGTLLEFELTATPEQADKIALVVFGALDGMPADFVEKPYTPASVTPAWVLQGDLGLLVEPGKLLYTIRTTDPDEIATVVGCVTPVEVPAAPPATTDTIYPAALLYVVPK